MPQRSQNTCRVCRSTWYPRGQDLSEKCPRCGSRAVTFAFAVPRTEVAPTRTSSTPVTGCFAIGCFSVLGLFGILFLVGLATMPSDQQRAGTPPPNAERKPQNDPAKPDPKKEPRKESGTSGSTADSDRDRSKSGNARRERLGPPATEPVELQTYQAIDAWREGPILRGRRFLVTGEATISYRGQDVVLDFRSGIRRMILCFVPLEDAGPLKERVEDGTVRIVVIEAEFVKAESGVVVLGRAKLSKSAIPGN